MKISTLHHDPAFNHITSGYYSTAYTNAIGLELTDLQAGAVRTRIHRTDFNYSTNHPQQIDPLAVIGLIDHSFVVTIASLFADHIGMSTLDLRIDYCGNTPATCMQGYAECIFIESAQALLRAQVVNEHGQLIAHGLSQFRVGANPGRTVTDVTPPAFIPPAQPQPLATTLGILHGDGRTCIQQHNPNIAGFHLAHVYHGAAISHLLAAAMQNTLAATEPETSQQLTSLQVNFVKPGRAGARLDAQTEIIRCGKAASTLSARSFHEDGATVASALATFS